MPSGDKNIKNKGVKFGSGQPTNLGGRKKKIYNILKEKGYGKDDIETAFNEIGWYSVKELKTLVKKDDTPAIVLVVAMAYKKAIENGDYRLVSQIIEQVIGKATQKVESETKVSIDKPANFEWE